MEMIIRNTDDEMLLIYYKDIWRLLAMNSFTLENTPRRGKCKALRLTREFCGSLKGFFQQQTWIHIGFLASKDT